MSTSFKGTVGVTFSGTYTKAEDIVTGNVAVSLPYSVTYALESNRSGSHELGWFFADSRSVSSGGTDAITIANLRDVFNNAPGAYLNMLYIKAAAANTTVLTVTPNTARMFFGTLTDLFTLQPGATVFMLQPHVGFATTGILNITNAVGALANYDIFLATSDQ